MFSEQFTLKEGEQLEDLQLASLFILQKRTGFRFGFDAVALADFATARHRDKAVDLGTGTGILPLLMYGRNNALTFDALEIQPDMADMAQRSVAGNRLTRQIRVHCHDIRRVEALLPRGEYSLVVSNPPYSDIAQGEAPKDAARAQAMVQVSMTLVDVVKAARYLLKFGGRLCVCLKASRAAEAMNVFEQFRIEPKRVRFVHATADVSARLMLLEGKYGAKRGLTVLPPLIVADANGEPSAQMRRIYHLP